MRFLDLQCSVEQPLIAKRLGNPALNRRAEHSTKLVTSKTVGGIVSCQTQKPQNQASLSLICTKRGLFFCLAFCVPKVRPILLLQQNPALGLLPSNFYLSGHKTQLEDVPWPLKTRRFFWNSMWLAFLSLTLSIFGGQTPLENSDLRSSFKKVELLLSTYETRYVPW